MITKGFGIVSISVSAIATVVTAWLFVMYQEVIPEIVSLIFIPAMVGFALLNVSKRKSRVSAE